MREGKKDRGSMTLCLLTDLDYPRRKFTRIWAAAQR